MKNCSEKPSLRQKITTTLWNISQDPLITNLISFIFRCITPPLRINPSGLNWLNLGCGPEYVDGFINVDFFTSRFRKDYSADLRYPLKIPSEAINGIFSEHTIEHLSYSQVDILLAECYRILKPGGVIRLITPDMRTIIKEYISNNSPWFNEWERIMFKESKDLARKQRVLHTPLQAISFLAQENGHLSLWDEETLCFFLQRNNFSNIQKETFRQGREKKLLIDLDNPARKLISLYIEAEKKKS